MHAGMRGSFSFWIVLGLWVATGAAGWGGERRVRADPADGSMVTFAGDPTVWGLEVQGVTVAPGEILVETTAARIRITTQEMVCEQKLSASEAEGLRAVVRVRFDTELTNLALAEETPQAAVVHSDQLWLGVQGDSMVVLHPPVDDFVVHVTSAIDAEWWRYTEYGYLLALDPLGGFACAYERPVGTPTMPIESRCFSACSVGSVYSYHLPAEARLGVGVSPGRPFPRSALYKDLIVMHGHLPSDQEMMVWRNYTDIFLYFDGYVGGTSGYPYEYVDADAVRARFADMHALGWKIMAYMDTQSVVIAEPDKEAVLAWMEAFRADMGFDGWYFDGLYVGSRWTYAYEFLRQVREQIGPDNPIYIHCTYNAGALKDSCPMPWIEGAYATAVLKGENRPIQGVNDPYLRYVVGQCRTSNCIGTLKWNSSTLSAPEAYTVMLKLHGSARWGAPGGDGYPDPGTSAGIWRDYFYPNLKMREILWALGVLDPEPDWPLNDADHDRLPDDWEFTYFPSDLTKLSGIEQADLDADGLTDRAEWATTFNWTSGTDPTNADTDDDGLPDGWEMDYCLSPRHASDAGRDDDEDGLTNLDEFLLGTNPTHPDTDADGAGDGVDNCPLHFNPDQADCDADEMGDVCALARGFALDCNDNGVPDGCDVTAGTSPDCNENGTPDECDVESGDARDDDETGIPDSCEVGDMNCDGEVNLDDVAPFVNLIVLGPVVYEALYDCPWRRGDTNDDGRVDIHDVNRFVLLVDL